MKRYIGTATERSRMQRIWEGSKLQFLALINPRIKTESDLAAIATRTGISASMLTKVRELNHPIGIEVIEKCMKVLENPALLDADTLDTALENSNLDWVAKRAARRKDAYAARFTTYEQKPRDPKVQALKEKIRKAKKSGLIPS